jgi:type I restriction enzyme S subunit
MAFDSQRLRLKDVASIVGGGTPSTSNAEYWGGNIPWLTPKDLSSNNEVYVTGGDRYLTKKGLQESSAKLLPTGSVLFSSRAPIGYIAIAQNEIATNQGFKSLKVNNEHNNIYFYYLLKHLTPYIQSIATGSTFKEISGNDLGNIEVDVPSLDIQKKISNCLLTLDKKISNLRAINQTLESIAQAIFKSWFVDFDPAHARQQGNKCAGIDDATADLFPDSFVESELGLIPKGWSKSNIGEIANVIDCLHSKKPEILNDGKIYLQLNNIRDDGTLDTEKLSYISELDYKKWTSRIEVKQGDCIITNVGRVGAVCQIPYSFY